MSICANLLLAWKSNCHIFCTGQFQGCGIHTRQGYTLNILGLKVFDDTIMHDLFDISTAIPFKIVQLQSNIFYLSHLLENVLFHE